MKKSKSRREWWQHLAKLANCKNETERIIENVQYFTSLGVSDYYHSYNTKHYAKSIMDAKNLFEIKGFTVEDQKSGIKGQSILHISWANATHGIAFTFACASKRASKTNEIIGRILNNVETAATNGEFSYQYDFNNDDASIDLKDSVVDNLTRTGDFNKIDLVDNMLILEWRY